MGYRAYAAPFRDTDYGEKVPILLILGDREELAHRKSPLARCAARYPDDAAVREWFLAVYLGHAGAAPADPLPTAVTTEEADGIPGFQ